jgi:hypothetical protein
MKPANSKPRLNGKITIENDVVFPSVKVPIWKKYVSPFLLHRKDFAVFK